jgi:hypothetical protein
MDKIPDFSDMTPQDALGWLHRMNTGSLCNLAHAVDEDEIHIRDAASLWEYVFNKRCEVSGSWIKTSEYGLAKRKKDILNECKRELRRRVIDLSSKVPHRD